MGRGINLIMKYVGVINVIVSFMACGYCDFYRRCDACKRVSDMNL